MNHQLRHRTAEPTPINIWDIGVDGHSILATIKVASAPPVIVRIPVRYRKRLAQEGEYIIHPIGGDCWVIESGVFHEDLPRVSLLLTAAPAEVSEQLFRT